MTATLGGHSLPDGSVTDTTADANGNVAISIALPTDAQSGRQVLVVKGNAAGLGVSDLASATLDVLPAPGVVGISPNPAQVGTILTAEANGFQPNEPVTVALRYYDTGLNSYAVVSVPTDANSSGTATAEISVPHQADPTRDGTLNARGISSGVVDIGTVKFAANASLTITPAGAIPGSQVTITGMGFVPRERLFVTTRLFSLPAGNFAVPDATGVFTATVTLLSTLQPGTAYSLSISGTGGDNAGTTYTPGAPVPPAFGLSPTDTRLVRFWPPQDRGSAAARPLQSPSAVQRSAFKDRPPSPTPLAPSPPPLSCRSASHRAHTQCAPLAFKRERREAHPSPSRSARATSGTSPKDSPARVLRSTFTRHSRSSMCKAWQWQAPSRTSCPTGARAPCLCRSNPIVC